MLVTDLALRDMEQEADSLVGSLGRLLGRLRRHHPAPPARPLPSSVTKVTGVATVRQFPSLGDDPRPAGNVMLDTAARFATQASDLAGDSPFKWRRHPQLRDRSRDMDVRSEGELRRDAKAAAVRGLFLARSERLGEARSAFAQAAGDASIDLSELPGFWHLSRGAMLIAAVAYEDVGRFRDAASLAARVRTRYRPRAVAPLTTASRRRAVGGGG